MEKKLLTEIKRIHQLMSIKSNILSEQVPPSLVRKGLKYGDELLDDIMKLIKNEDEAVDVAATIEKAAKKGETLSDDFYEEIIKKTSITDLAALLKTKGLLGNISSIDTKFFQSTDKLLSKNKLTAEKIDEYINAYRQSLDEYPNLSNEIKDGLTEVFETEIKGRYPNVVTKNIESNLKSLEDDLVGDLNSTSDKINSNISATYIPSFVRFFTKYWKNVFRSQAKLDELIKETIDTIVSKSKKNIAYDVDFENLYMYVLAKRKSRDYILKDEMNKTIFQNPKISKQVKSLMDDKDAFKEIKASWDAVKKSESSNTYGPALEQTHAILESLPIGNFFSKLSKKGPITKKDYLKLILPEPKRLFNLVTWKDPRGVSETVAHITRYGRNRTIASKIITTLVVQHGILPLILASFNTAKQNWDSGKSYVNLITAKEFCKTVKELYPDKPMLKECNNLPEVVEAPTEEDFIRYYKESLPFDYFDTNPYGENTNYIKTLFFWTFWDEIAIDLGKFMYNLMFKPWNTQAIENVYNTIDNKLKLELKNYGWDPNKSNEENMKVINEKFKNKAEEVKDKITNFKEVVTSKGEEAAFNLWGQTQNPKLSFKEFEKLSDGSKSGFIIGSDENKYQLKDDGLGYTKEN